MQEGRRGGAGGGVRGGGQGSGRRGPGPVEVLDTVVSRGFPGEGQVSRLVLCATDVEPL